MDLKTLIETLHPLERRLVPFLAKFSTVPDLVKASGMQEVEVTRALQWLENKAVLKTSSDSKEFVALGGNGKRYAESGLPEKMFLSALLSGKTSLNDIASAAKLDPAESAVAIGILKQKGAMDVAQGNFFKITELGRKLSGEKWPEENLVSKIAKGSINLNDLSRDEAVVFENLRKRRDIVILEIKKTKSFSLLDLGKELVKQKVSGNYIDKLNPDLLRTGKWQGERFRRYDIKADVPSIFGGRKQHYRRFLEGVRQRFIGLGFREMSGPIVESEFWNMDALFMPQFHSARDIHDAYYIKEPKYGKLDEKLVSKVASEHEKGWKYDFDEKRTHRNILRTQGTACSVRMLASKDLQIPGKYFGITRCFRHDVIDATHLPDFHQTEGIVVEEGLNLRHLFGLLQMFAKEFTGAEQIKIVPGYFPFTEPSCELYAKHPDLGWIELGGAGIFRQEVVKPLLGKNISVLAWGLGIDRIAMFKLGIKDIRELFSHNLEFLRNARVV